MKNKLITPIKNMHLTAGYKNKQYLKYWGWNHYGIDVVSTTADRTIRASGDGVVVAAGADGSAPNKRLGNVMAVVYYGETTCRYYHLDKCLKKAGDKVKRGEPIAIYGNTGANTTGPHLHFEIDTDTVCPTHAPGLAGNGYIMKAGVDSTLSPLDNLYMLEGDTYTAANDGWCSVAEKIVPILPDESTIDYKTKYDKLLTDLERLVKQYRG